MPFAPSANVARMSESHPPNSEAMEGVHSERADTTSDAGRLSRYDILRVRAPNPGPLTLSGTNTWVVGRNPTWVIDPGPAIDTHLERLNGEIEARGGLGGIALTHDHGDHSEAVGPLRERHPAPLAGGRGMVDVLLGERSRFGPFDVIATPGHSADHVSLLTDGACFTGDAVLGEGSVFISPYPGAMAAYMLALTRLRLREDINILCPGHGPPVWDAHAKLGDYLDHRIDREHSLILALGEGRRTIRGLLDSVWPEVPEELRPLATATLAAYLDKFEDEHVLPAGVERPRFERGEW
jgi:glyoxylase-like metal-dependent hydrolase (beta-lactamase superfamily II)